MTDREDGAGRKRLLDGERDPGTPKNQLRIDWDKLRRIRLLEIASLPF
jgi:hypothetical protein